MLFLYEPKHRGIFSSLHWSTFKKSFLGWLVVNDIYKQNAPLENIKNALRYFFFRNFCFTNLLTVIADKIVKKLKASGATQAVVLDISKAFYRAWHDGIL